MTDDMALVREYAVHQSERAFEMLGLPACRSNEYCVPSYSRHAGQLTDHGNFNIISAGQVPESVRSCG